MRVLSRCHPTFDNQFMIAVDAIGPIDSR
jgi:hypothetical protein